MKTQAALQKTYITDADGNELPITETRDPRAALHFTQVGRIPDGLVWRCDSISGRALTHRLTFSSYAGAWETQPLGWLLFRQMLAHERVANWERDLEAQHACAA